MNFGWVTVLCCLALASCQRAASPGQSNSDRPDVPSIFREMARIRQLPKQALPEVVFLSREEFSMVFRDSPSQRANGELDVQQELGIAPKGSVVRLEEQRVLMALGVYDSRSRAIYVVEEPTRFFPFAEEGVLAHESVHALQHERRARSRAYRRPHIRTTVSD